jgi:hypothetical protein
MAANVNTTNVVRLPTAAARPVSQPGDAVMREASRRLPQHPARFIDPTLRKVERLDLTQLAEFLELAVRVSNIIKSMP